MATSPYTYTGNKNASDGTSRLRFFSTEDGFLYEVALGQVVSLNSADLARLGLQYLFAAGATGLPVSPVRAPVEVIQENTNVGEILTRTTRGFEFESGVGGLAGHTILDEGTPFPGRSGLNFIGPTITVADDIVNQRTNVTISGASGHTIQDEGNPLTARTGLNFTGVGVTATDDAANNRTNVTISGSATAVDSTLVDAKGDLIAATADNAVARLPVGTNNQVLAADSAQSTGLRWVTPTADYSILDAKGDLIAATGDNAAARVGIGANNQVLTADSTQATGMKWATPSAGGAQVIYTEIGAPAPNPASYPTGTLWVEVTG